MRIGLLSDTHGYLDPRIGEYFKNCDEIWHAGDIGEIAVLQQLEQLKPVRAVFGNIDDRAMQNRLPEDLRFTCEGVDVFMTHIGGTPPRYNPRVKRILTQSAPQLFICGHSHILKVGRDAAFRDMLFLNPGAAGNHGFHTIKTIVRLTLSQGAVSDLEVIELGKRGELIT
ncbi:MAG TPA: metallophosphoesterase family protein [Ohtaekwangia sp.]|nr:metallophosphoesterase family protein [Ohtaekwangia sp.]